VSDVSAARLAQGLAHHRAGRLDAAAAHYHAVLAVEPRSFDALHLLAVVVHRQGRPAEALAWFDRALAIDASGAPVHANRAAALRDLRRTDEALAALDRALAIEPRQAVALANRAAVHLDRGDPQAALDDACAALAIDASEPSAAYNRASALKALGRRDEALAAFGALQRERPDLAPLPVHLGQLLREAGRPAEALAAFERAVALAPADPAAWTERGHALAELGRHDEAQASYARALGLEPDAPGLLGHWLHAKLQGCDWEGLDAAFARLAAAVDAGRAACEPFVALLTPLSAAQQRRCAEAHVRLHAPAPSAAATWAQPRREGRLRIGYFSADFREHATTQLLVGVLEQHDRAAFEVTAFAYGPPARDALRGRVQAAVEHFVDVQAASDAQVVALARERELDIAVDLGGATRGGRPGVFARRVAPLQVAWLGFAGPSGAPFVDYTIADREVLPPERAGAEFGGAIVWLPHSYQPNDDRRAIAARPVARAELGLPDDAFVFCCFNQAAKLGPDVFACWMALLHAVPGSVLWLLRPGPGAVGRLQRAARSHGVDAARLVFAPRLAPQEHLARHAAADLFLDTWPYNAHTTASDALWAGLPVLSRRGETFAGRVGASLLEAAGLPELVVGSAEAYVDLARDLAHDRARLAGLRARLARERLRCPLFDTAGFTRALEAAFAAMARRHAAGDAPASFAVPR